MAETIFCGVNTPTLDSIEGDFADILQLLGKDNFPCNVDIIITELSRCAFKTFHSKSGNVEASRRRSKVVSKSLERLCSMLKIKIVNIHNVRAPRTPSDDTFYKNLIENCLINLYELRDDKDKCIPLYCDVIGLALMLLEHNDIYFKDMVTLIAGDCQNRWKEFVVNYACETDLETIGLSGSSKVLISLTVFEFLLHVLMTKRTRSNFEQTLIGDETSSMLIQLIFQDHSLPISHMLTHIIPKIVSLTCSDKLLRAIWSHLCNFMLENSSLATVPLPVSRIFFVLCSLAECFIPHSAKDETKPLNVNLLTEPYYWKIIQTGLVNEDGLVQKQALYLLKRSIDASNTFNVSINTENGIFYWDSTYSKELLKTWEDFFLVLETVDEKQVHIVTPVLAVISKLIEQRSLEAPLCYTLHESWFFCIFHRVLKHDHKSVVTWGVLSFIELKLKFFATWDNLCALELLVNTLNNSFLFCSTGSADQPPSEVRNKLALFFQNLTHLPSTTAQITFYNVLKVVSAVSWSAVPLFFVVHALACVPKVPLWDRAALGLVKQFVADALGTQHIFVRGGIQCQLLKAVVQLADTKELDLADVCDVLSSFRKTEAIKRGTHSWTTVVNWMKSFVDEGKIQTLFAESLCLLRNTNDEAVKHNTTKVPTDRKAFARIIVLVCDLELHETRLLTEKNTETMTLFREMFKLFENAEKRLYACEKTQDINLELLTYILQEAEALDGTCKTEPNSLAYLLTLTYSNMHNIITVITKRLGSLCHLRDIDTVNQQVNALKTFSNYPILCPAIAKNISSLQYAAIEIAQGDTYYPLQKYFAQQLLSWMSSPIKNLSAIGEKQKMFLKGIIDEDRLNEVLVKNLHEEHLTRDLNTQWGHIVSGYIRATWALFAEELDFTLLGEWFADVTVLLEDALDCLEITGKSVLYEIMRVLEIALPACLATGNTDLPLKVIESCWDACFELRRTESFWSVMQQFVRMTYQSDILDRLKMQQPLIEYGLRLLKSGESIMGLGNLLLSRLQQVLTPELIETYAVLVVEALLFGPCHRRDQRPEDEAVEFIIGLGHDCSVNDLVSCVGKADNEVRARAVDIVLRIGLLSMTHKPAATLANCLITREHEETSGKTRFYGDSLTHRFKNRVVQALLLLQPWFDENTASYVLKWASTSLIGDGLQPSIRYLLEWLVARIMLSNTSLHAQVWNLINTSGRKRPRSICSFMSALYLVSTQLMEPDFVDHSLQVAIPQCIAQHFSCRLYAQVTIKKLFSIAQDRGWQTLISKYSLIEQCLVNEALEGHSYVDNSGEGTTVRGEGNAIRNFRRIRDSWAFSVFDPVAHYSLTTIYHQLPRLGCVAYNEWLPLKVFEDCNVVPVMIPLSSSDTRLAQMSPSAGDIQVGNENDAEGDDDAPATIQKKLVPWTSMLPGDTRKDRKVCKEGLVLVASLIHKAPNVGGLCRTCEVFGAARFVIGHSRLLQDKEFTSLSVTAEKWITLQEVSPFDLPKYLASMKKQGYLLVGAEQTSNSTPIQQMTFPKKTLLLLGNEREGIPVNLLPLLDVCVVIPQCGVVRSLNVHVTGAICVWEYFRQHSS